MSDAQMLHSQMQNMNITEAFEAGIRAANPEAIMDGIYSHHKDITISDKRKEHLAQLKAEKIGPDNPAGVIVCHNLLAFNTFVVAHKETRTAIFANAETKTIRAIFDFREPFTDQGASNGWGQFSAELAFKESRKLKEWKRTTEPMSQGEFANFLEDHVDDVLEPSGVDLLSIATDLEASSTGSFVGRVNMQNGNVSLSYQDETKTTVEVPKEIVLGIPLFENGNRYRLRARLRYIVGGGQVKFRLLFVNLADAIDQEFASVVGEMKELTFQDHVVILGEAKLPW